MMKKLLLLKISVLILFLSGCATTVHYNPSYIDTFMGTNIRLVDEGNALIFTQQADDDYVFRGSPSSYTGAAMTLEIPLGRMTRETAYLVFSKIFKGNCAAGTYIMKDREFSLIIRPRVTFFDYKFNQLKNAGFAVTPQVQMVLTVDIFDKGGGIIHRKEFDSGIVDGESYVINMNPMEEINITAHKVLSELMIAAAKDAQTFLMSAK